MTVLRRGLVLLAGAGLLAGCTGHSTAGGPPSPEPTTVAACVSADEQRGGGVRLPGDGDAGIDAVLLGTGTTGVVLANQSDEDLCGWKSTYAGHLLGLGYRVGVFNYTAQGPPDSDVTAVAAALRERGATKLFLVGASMGGTAVLGAASRADPAVAGVISISGPAAWAGVNAVEAVPHITVPALFIAAEYDSPFVDNARTLYRDCAARDKNLSIEPGSAHGTGLLTDHVSSLIDAFLKAH
jgi:hypothetical protein